MPFSHTAADNLWDFEDFARRVHQRLFDPALSPKRLERNRQYRLGLLQIMDGLMTETPFEIAEGMDRIASVFPHLAAPTMPSEDHQ